MATSGLVRWLITANVQQGSSLVVTVVIIVEESQYLCFLMDIHSFPNKVFKTSPVTLEFDLRTIKVTLKWPTDSDWHQKYPHFLRGLRAWNDPKLLGLEPHRNPHGLRTAPFERSLFLTLFSTTQGLLSHPKFPGYTIWNHQWPSWTSLTTESYYSYSCPTKTSAGTECQHKSSSSGIAMYSFLCLLGRLYLWDSFYPRAPRKLWATCDDQPHQPS